MQTGLLRHVVLAAPALAMLLAGCVTDSQPSRVFVRADGRAHADDPELAKQYQAAAASCRSGQGEQFRSVRGSSTGFSQRDLPAGIAASNRSTASGPISESCMADQGYVLVSRDQADAKRAELLAAAEKAKQEAASQLAAPAQRRR